MPGEDGRGKLSSGDRLKEEDRKAVEKEYMGAERMYGPGLASVT